MRIGVVFPQTELGGDVGAVRAYGVLDGTAAAAVVAADQRLDDLYTQLLRELFSLRQASNEPLVEAGSREQVVGLA